MSYLDIAKKVISSQLSEVRKTEHTRPINDRLMSGNIVAVKFYSELCQGELILTHNGLTSSIKADCPVFGLSELLELKGKDSETIKAIYFAKKAFNGSEIVPESTILDEKNEMYEKSYYSPCPMCENVIVKHSSIDAAPLCDSCKKPRLVSITEEIKEAQSYEQIN